MAKDMFHVDPFTELNAYRDALRQLVEGGWNFPRDLMPAAITAVVIPLDLLDTGPALVVQSNLPGVKVEDLNVTVTGSILTIQGALKERDDFPGATYLRHERRAANFSRSINLPVEVDAEHAEARLKEGVLTLTLPKSDAVRPKNIKIDYE